MRVRGSAPLLRGANAASVSNIVSTAMAERGPAAAINLPQMPGASATPRSSRTAAFIEGRATNLRDGTSEICSERIMKCPSPDEAIKNILPTSTANDHESGNPFALKPQIHPVFEPGMMFQPGHSLFCLPALVVDSEHGLSCEFESFLRHWGSCNARKLPFFCGD